METLTPEKETIVEVETQTEKLQSEKETVQEKKTFQPFAPKKTSIFSVLKEKNDAEKEVEKEALKEGSNRQTAYLQSLENKTVADIMEERRKKEKEEFEAEKEQLIQKQYEKPKAKEEKAKPNEREGASKTIERPNFDLMEENKRVVKLFKNQKQQTQKKKKSSKTAGLVLACTLAGCGIVCVANTVVIDSMNKSLLQIDETYHLNLQKYLKEITKLDQTNKSLEFLETYPEDILDAGDLGQKSNWFDKLCNFFGSLFGG